MGCLKRQVHVAELFVEVKNTWRNHRRMTPKCLTFTPLEGPTV